MTAGNFETLIKENGDDKCCQATETRLVGIYFLFKQRGKPTPACGRVGLTSAHRGRSEALTSVQSNEENRLPLAGHPNILRADVSDEETSPAMIR